MEESYLGGIAIVGFDFAPRGWALCNGQILPINQNQALFSLLGTQYGGMEEQLLPCRICRGEPRCMWVIVFLRDR